MSDLKMLYEGKAKILYQGPSEEEVFIYFKDDTTAFNGEKKEQIKEKGQINLQITRYIFRYLEKHGIPTHYLKPVDENTILAKKIDIIPVEFVIRNIATGSLLKRTPLKEGKKLKQPLLEFFYKDDEMGDPMITPFHVEECELCSQQDMMRATELTYRINHVLKKLFDKVGIDLVDFKVEFGKDKEGNLMLGDEISPDSCRLWNKIDGKKLDKDVFRKDLGDMIEKYKEVLHRLKEELDD